MKNKKLIEKLFSIEHQEPAKEVVKETRNWLVLITGVVVVQGILWVLFSYINH